MESMKRMKASSYAYKFTSYSLDSFDSFYCSFKFLLYDYFWNIWSICFLVKYAKKHQKASFMFQLPTLIDNSYFFLARMSFFFLFVSMDLFKLKSPFIKEPMENVHLKKISFTVWEGNESYWECGEAKLFLLQTSHILYNSLKNPVWWWQP